MLTVCMHVKWIYIYYNYSKDVLEEGIAWEQRSKCSNTCVVHPCCLYAPKQPMKKCRTNSYTVFIHCLYTLYMNARTYGPTYVYVYVRIDINNIRKDLLERANRDNQRQP